MKYFVKVIACPFYSSLAHVLQKAYAYIIGILGLKNVLFAEDQANPPKVDTT